MSLGEITARSIDNEEDIGMNFDRRMGDRMHGGCFPRSERLQLDLPARDARRRDAPPLGRVVLGIVGIAIILASIALTRFWSDHRSHRSSSRRSRGGWRWKKGGCIFVIGRLREQGRRRRRPIRGELHQLHGRMGGSVRRGAAQLLCSLPAFSQEMPELLHSEVVAGVDNLLQHAEADKAESSTRRRL